MTMLAHGGAMFSAHTMADIDDPPRFNWRRRQGLGQGGSAGGWMYMSSAVHRAVRVPGCIWGERSAQTALSTSRTRTAICHDRLPVLVTPDVETAREEALQHGCAAIVTELLGTQRRTGHGEGARCRSSAATKYEWRGGWGDGGQEAPRHGPIMPGAPAVGQRKLGG